MRRLRQPLLPRLTPLLSVLLLACEAQVTEPDLNQEDLPRW
jgi:hypothetical protein